MRKFILFLLVLVLANNVNAFYEDFEDGNYTANPSWTLYNSVGDDEILPDPVRGGNTVLAMKGSYYSHRAIQTSVSVRLRDFYFEADFMASQNSFHPIFSLNIGGERLRTRLLVSGDNTSWAIVENAYNEADWARIEPNPSIINSQPINEWWNMKLWYDIEAEQVVGEVHRLSDNFLLCSKTSAISELNPESIIDTFVIEAEKPYWQYFDNVQLVPEPATILLLSLGGLVLRRKK